MKKVFLISTTAVEDRNKHGKKMVHLVATLNTVNQYYNDIDNKYDFNYVIGSCIKDAEGNVPMDVNGRPITTFKENEIGGITVNQEAIDLDLFFPVENGEELQFNINSQYFLKYCNDNNLYGLEWELLE